MQRITADDSVEEVLARLGVGEDEKLRESEKRRSNLEKFAKLRSRNPNVTLDIQNTPTAFVEVEEGDIEEFRNITVTSKEFEQVESNLPEKYHSYLLQKAQTGHEVGHVLYSSWPALEEFEEKVRDEEDVDTEQYVQMFRNFVNVLEDGAIERFLGEDFRIEEELYHLRQTLHEQTYMGSQSSNGQEVIYFYPFFFAIMTACLNIGVYDNGELDKLLDEDDEEHCWPPGSRGGGGDRKRFVNKCLPKIEEYIPKIQSEPDAYKRTELCYELWDFLVPYIDRAPTGSKDKFDEEMSNHDGDGYSPGVPNNLSESHGEQSEEPIFVGGEGDEESSLGDERNEMAKGGDVEVEDTAERGIISESKQQGDGDWSEEIEELINALGAGDGVKELAIAEDGEIDSQRRMAARKLGKRCEKVFKNRLQQTKKDTTIRGQRRGNLDTRSLVKAERGSPRIFKQTDEGEEKNYSCIIVTDRSGSMSGTIDDVELAAGAVAWGLQENGVDTSILDTHNSMTTLAKPFGTSVESFEEKLFTNRVGGGTPITGTMQFMRERIDRGENDYPFAIVITDGGARNVDAFKDEVKKANFPVLGLYLEGGYGDIDDQLKHYNKAISINSGEDVSQALINLINSVIL